MSECMGKSPGGLAETCEDLATPSEERSEGVQYCLTFELGRRENIRMFLLKETTAGNQPLRTPKSLDTSSDEVFEVTQRWIKKCTCARLWDKPGNHWYPKRLIDLQALRNANGLRDIDGLTIESERGDIERTRVTLVELPDDSKHVSSSGQPVLRAARTGLNFRYLKRENDRYVTLSHCWGKPKSVQGQLRLSRDTEERFKREGIELRELPKTFRDAMLFACRLEKVGFIWIDSLCILQPTTSSSNDAEAKADWLEESRKMDEIYRHSFLNISATAAVDGDEGLFCSRQPEYLWEDEINVNFTGTNMISSVVGGSVREDTLKRCTLIDVSFWDELVANAPVNRRGWVLQERLMAPRVLHFCRNQVAWECAGFKDAEGHPEMNPTIKARSGRVVDEGRFKNLTLAAGKKLRENRLKGLDDPDKGMPDLYMYELWKRIVEAYSQMHLTVSRDKLIALSGVARRFVEDDNMFQEPNNAYIAGLWRHHLESQLLWQVKELYKDGAYENPGRRDATRAPSFSWASIDTPHGIIYPDVTNFGNSPEEVEQNLFIKVTDSPIKHADKKNPYGMVESCELHVQPRYLRQIELRKLQPPHRNPYSWRLTMSPAATTTSQPAAEYTNMYLDAPDTDVDIFGAEASMYCMPVANGERTVRRQDRYLHCLLLKYLHTASTQMDDGTIVGSCRIFRRIGITKLSNYAESDGQEALKNVNDNMVGPNETICLW